MAQAVPEKVGTRQRFIGQIGCQLLNVVTTGMYSEPRMALREYIQNSADAIDLAEEQGLLESGSGSIDIYLDGQERSLTILDNGTGVPNADIGRTLGSVGISGKAGTLQRGFRGIGRLGGIAYSRSVTFETRSCGDKRVGVVEWNGDAMRNLIARSSPRRTPTTVIQEATALSFRPAELSEPSHFFRVTLHGVAPFHRDELMNPLGLSGYVAQVAPVPLSTHDFRFAQRVESHLSSVRGYRCYHVRLNGKQIVRPISDTFEITRRDSGRVQDVELFELAGTDAQTIGRGWYAVTDYAGSVTRGYGGRGVRIRQGNIQVGDEYFLADLFTERRFATWHIGEIHLDPCVRPNARRDGFEHSPQHERFLEQAQLLARHLSWLCRSSSENRGTARAAELRLLEIEQHLDVPFFIDEEHMRAATAAAAGMLDRFEASLEGDNRRQQVAARIDLMRERVRTARQRPLYLRSCLDRRKLVGVRHEDVVVCAYRMLAEHTGNGLASDGPAMAFLCRYLKPTILGKLGELLEGRE
ncbi:MAG: ATP-binding protein [Armatimonadetes bacterium]|nr:ATP-binding protein [Armatimonadota bacterium]